MKKILILIFLLFSNNNYNYVYNLGLCNLINFIIIYRITKQDVLDNKQINHHIKIRDYIFQVHREVMHFNYDFRKQNIKLFNSALARVKLTYNEIVQSKLNKNVTK